jgi:hypothetical protein
MAKLNVASIAATKRNAARVLKEEKLLLLAHQTQGRAFNAPLTGMGSGAP